MAFVLEMRSTANWNDVRYRAYTTSARKAEAFKSVPKVKFTDSGHGIVPHVAEHRGKREPAINVLADHVRQAMGGDTLSDGPTTHREWADHYRLLCAELLAALIMLRDADDIGVREGYSGTMGASQRACVDTAIAKAEGRP
jgi:hypothetical protein